VTIILSNNTIKPFKKTKADEMELGFASRSLYCSVYTRCRKCGCRLWLAV